MPDLSLFLLVTAPVMLLLGVRHALDVDHITGIDNLVRLHNVTRRARWIGGSFSLGHMSAVCVELVAIVYIVKSLEAHAGLQFYGGIVGAAALASIGGINLWSMRRFGKTGAAMLTPRISRATKITGPFGSAFITGLIFGLGFDTASQISALTVSAVASATQGLQAALILAGFFAVGMIPTDTLDSLLLRSVFSRIIDTNGFKAISYGLSVVALSVAAAESYSVISGVEFLPAWAGATLAVTILAGGFVYAKQKDGFSKLPMRNPPAEAS